MAKRKKGKKTNNGQRNTIQTIQWPSEKRAKRQTMVYVTLYRQYNGQAKKGQKGVIKGVIRSRKSKIPKE